LKLYISRFLHK